MRFFIPLFSLLLCQSLFGKELRVYTYDSFQGKGSLGEIVGQAFARKTGATCRFVSFPSASEALNQIALEGKKTKADLLVGVDAGILVKARSLGFFAKLERTDFPALLSEFWFDDDSNFAPFDYGDLSVLYDSRRVNVPDSLTWKQFAESPAYRKKLAIQDPRTSSIGLSFLFWTVALFEGEAFPKFWGALRRQILTVAPGWSGAYSLFQKGEVDFVVSYTTSVAYHVEKEKNLLIKSIHFSDGNYRQIEGAGIVAGSPQRDLASEWLKILASPDIQAQLPTTQLMYPVARVALPKSFTSLPVVKHPIRIDPRQNFS